VSRDRQRSKQRQAERRARRLEQQRAARSEPDLGDGGQAGAADPGLEEARGGDGPAALDDPRAAPPAPGLDPALAVGAPPQDEGRSDTVMDEEPELDEGEHLLEDEIEAEEEAEAEEAYEPRGRRGLEVAPAAKDRPRFVQFLIASWAELQRVQWPNRQALTTLTGVVLGFVLIAGGYLGLLDAIFSRLIQAIL
jgi:preprotein translocase SecE subunit